MDPETPCIDFFEAFPKSQAHLYNMSDPSATSKAVDTAKVVSAPFTTPLEETTQTTRSFIHHPYTRFALPFINGGISGMVGGS